MLGGDQFGQLLEQQHGAEVGIDFTIGIEQRNVDDDGELAIGPDQAVGNGRPLGPAGFLEVGAVGQVVLFQRALNLVRVRQVMVAIGQKDENNRQRIALGEQGIEHPALVGFVLGWNAVQLAVYRSNRIEAGKFLELAGVGEQGARFVDLPLHGLSDRADQRLVLDRPALDGQLTVRVFKKDGNGRQGDNSRQNEGEQNFQLLRHSSQSPELGVVEALWRRFQARGLIIIKQIL